MKTLSMTRMTVIAGCLSAAVFAPAASAEVKLVGSGASFPFPIYSKWFKDFSGKHRDIRVDYQSKGSGAGIQDFINKTVDFAASDAAMNNEELSKVKGGAVLLPMTAGEIVLAYNLDGVNNLKLSRDVYPAIFMGKITKWNDPKIAAANPGVKLPDEPITVVVRSDASGTSYVYTGHLSAISPEFKSMVGQGKSPQWPSSDRFVKAPQNAGVTATIKQTPGAIGYIEYGYAKLTGWKHLALLQNKAGNYMASGPAAGKATLASAEFPTTTLPGEKVPDLRVWVSDPVGEKAYPIATFTWMLFYQEQDPAKAKAIHKLVEYCLTTGQKSADALGYIPLPKNVVEKNRAAMKFIR
jgi:phosphate transport system substrate-binding protein